MQIENFKIFADLVETKSFSKSARLNGITQSAVSQQARAMERHFKTLLIDRSQKQFQLTREGQSLYESAKEMLHTYDKLLSDLEELKKIISGTIRISTIYSVGLHELPPFIKRFLHDYPSVNVRVEYRRSNLVYEDILHNSVDFGLVAFPVKQRQIEMLPFRNDHLVLIAHPKHPLAKCGELELKQLAGQRAMVLKVHGEGALRRRLFDMGITPGAEILVRKLAPLGDPLEVTLRGYELSLRKAEAEAVLMDA